MDTLKTAVAMVRKAARASNAGQTFQAADNNRLEALKVLTNSVLREIETLRKERNVTNFDRVNLAEEVKRFEIDLIRCALIRSGGRQRQAAALLNVKVSTLNAKILRYDITQHDSGENPVES